MSDSVGGSLDCIVGSSVCSSVGSVDCSVGWIGSVGSVGGNVWRGREASLSLSRPALSQPVSAVEYDSVTPQPSPHLTSPSIFIEPSCCLSAIYQPSTLTVRFNDINPACHPVSKIILLNGCSNSRIVNLKFYPRNWDIQDVCFVLDISYRVRLQL